MTLHRYNPRRDANEKSLISGLTGRGFVVMAQLSDPGIPDLLCAYRGEWVLVEIKSEKGKLTSKQQAFRDKAHIERCPFFVIRSQMDIDLMVKAL